MDEFDQVLTDALKAVGSDYRPADVSGAQEEFLRRRRRLRVRYAAAGTVLAGASVLIALAVAGSLRGGRAEGETSPAAGPRLKIAAAIRVGSNPSGVALGAGSVWVANLGDGTVSRVDPASDEVVNIEVGGRPDDVIASEDVVWVTDSSNGRITPVSPESNRPGRSVTVAETGRHLDIAATGEDLWVAVAGDRIARLDRLKGKPSGGTSSPATDVAVDGDRVWFLDSHDGRAGEIDPNTLETIAEINVGPAGGGGGDMAVAGGRLWVTKGAGGILFGVDPESGEAVEITLGGTYAGVSADEDSVWVVTGTSENIGLLARVDTSTGEIVGRPLAILGVPHDVAVGFGSVWVSDNVAGSLLRVETSADGAASSPKSE